MTYLRGKKGEPEEKKVRAGPDNPSSSAKKGKFPGRKEE